MLWRCVAYNPHSAWQHNRKEEIAAAFSGYHVLGLSGTKFRRGASDPACCMSRHGTFRLYEARPNMQRELPCICATKSSLSATSNRSSTYPPNFRADWVYSASNVEIVTFVSLWHILGYKLAQLRNNSALVSCGHILEALLHIYLTVVYQSFSRMPMPKTGCANQNTVCSASNPLLLGRALLSLRTPAGHCSEVYWNNSFYVLSTPLWALDIHISAMLLESNRGLIMYVYLKVCLHMCFLVESCIPWALAFSEYLDRESMITCQCCVQTCFSFFRRCGGTSV